MIPANESRLEQAPAAALAAARAADGALGVLLEAVRFGLPVAELITRGQRGAAAAGIQKAVVGVDAASPTTGRSDELGGHQTARLGKAALVALTLRGWVGPQWLGLARTTIVGYDTLPEQMDLARGALRALVMATDHAHDGVRADELQAAARAAQVHRRLDGGHVLRLVSAERPSAGEPLDGQAVLRSGELIYVEVSLASDGDTVCLGDLVQVGRHAGLPLTKLARRLWL